MTTGEKQRLSGRGTKVTAAYDAFLKGWNYYNSWTPKGFRQAIPHFERAIDLDPDYGRAYATLASVYWEGGSQRLWYESLDLFWGEARSLAQENLTRALENPTPLAHRVASLIYLEKGLGGQVLRRIAQDFDRAIDEARKAIALDPNDPEGYVAWAHVLTMSGRPEEALANIDKAMRLNPRFPSEYLFQAAFAQFGMDNVEEAVGLLEKAIALNPENLFASYLRVVTYALLEREKKLAEAIKHFERVSPSDIGQTRYTRFWGLYKNREDNERIRRGLELAGFPH